MGSDIAIDPIVRFALWSTVGAFTLSGILIMQVFILRLLHVFRHRRHEKFKVQWRPIMIGTIWTESAISKASLPFLKRNNIGDFLVEWNSFHAGIRGEASESMNRLARHYGIDKVARSMFFHRRRRDRLMAIVTLGHLKDEALWDQLVAEMADVDPYLSAIAASAIMNTNPARGIKVFLEAVVRRSDWPPEKISLILQYAGADIVSGPLSDLIRKSPPSTAARLVQYLDTAHTDVEMNVVHELFESSDNDRLISECLRHVQNPNNIDYVRKYVRHERWHIRMLSATALGRIGEEADLNILTGLLSDKEWWVRYRAAQAIYKLPFGGVGVLRKIQSEQRDKYAIDIIEQVIVEVENV